MKSSEDSGWEAHSFQVRTRWSSHSVREHQRAACSAERRNLGRVLERCHVAVTPSTSQQGWGRRGQGEGGGERVVGLTL